MNLSQKIILVLLSMIIFIVTILTYFNVKEDEKIFNIQLENRVNLMKSQMLKNAKYTMFYHKNEIENDLAAMNLSHISKLLKQLIEREEIEGVSLVSEINKMQLFEGRPYHKAVDKETIEVNKNNIIIASPIVISKYWGTLTLVYTLETLNDDIRQAKEIGEMNKRNNIINALILASSIFFIFSLIVFFWVKRLTYPILLLTKFVQNMADGKLDVDEELSHIDRNDEVGVLAKTFQKMAYKLDHSYKELKRLNESLEEKVIERTKDLEKSKDELKVLASIDSMTKLYNRRYFSDISNEIFHLNKREHKSLALIMLDIDNFKKINDTYGHHIGDIVIISIADILLEHTRKSDVVCRYGGEEYMILLSEMHIDRCLEIAELIRTSVENMTVQVDKDRALNVTISIGIALSDMRVDNSIEIAINKADNALYTAKRAGKNRVAVYSEKTISVD